MKKTAKLIEKLIRLANGDALPASSLKGAWFEQMLNDGILLATAHGSRKSFRASDGMTLLQYVASQFDIHDLEQTRCVLSDEDVSRASLVAATGDSKFLSRRTFNRYYTPPPRPLASCERQRSGEAPALALTTDTSFHNIVTMTSGHGGVGLSVMASILAWTLARREHSCALIDADFVAGCLDLLLGVEREPGLRFSQVDAPLGRIEGDAMNHELMMWEGVRVLPYDPWSARQPDWWEVQAAIRALAETNDVVIVDAGQGGLIETVPDLRSGMQVMYSP